MPAKKHNYPTRHLTVLAIQPGQEKEVILDVEYKLSPGNRRWWKKRMKKSNLTYFCQQFPLGTRFYFEEAKPLDKR